MRFTFLVLFGMLFLGLNTVNAQACCLKANSTAANVSDKKCCLDKSTASTANATPISANKKPIATSAAAFVSVDNKKASVKSCDPSKCVEPSCDPSECTKTASTKSSSNKMAAKQSKSKTASL